VKVKLIFIEETKYAVLPTLKAIYWTI